MTVYRAYRTEQITATNLDELTQTTKCIMCHLSVKDGQG